jgi:hypothetical protein
VPLYSQSFLPSLLILNSPVSLLDLDKMGGVNDEKNGSKIQNAKNQDRNLKAV